MAAVKTARFLARLVIYYSDMSQDTHDWQDHRTSAKPSKSSHSGSRVSGSDEASGRPDDPESIEYMLNLWYEQDISSDPWDPLRLLRWLSEDGSLSIVEGLHGDDAPLGDVDSEESRTRLNS